MELILQQNLPHQQKAIDAVCDSLDGVMITPPVQFYENPQINLADEKLLANLQTAEYRSTEAVGSCLNLDIKMETGTGKTYVYTKTIYELHKRYGINKFIIAVPSLAIKAGTAQFMRDEYSRRHFTDGCGYGTEIELGVLEAPKNKKKGRRYFPSVVSDFIKGSCQNTKKIYVLLVNMQLLVIKANGMLSRDDYDYGAEGFYRPFDALRATKPVVIIDEPHRFSRDQKAFQTIMSEIQPQAVIRYGATFPETTTGRGQNKDYQNLLYDLNACESFNQGLIKGVAKEHFEPSSRRDEYIKITYIKKNDYIKIVHHFGEQDQRVFELHVRDSLSIISSELNGIFVEGIGVLDDNGKTSVQLTNGYFHLNDKLDVNVYMSSYLTEMMRLALIRHFETERINFSGRNNKIKTLALFFIDDITSYTGLENDRDGFLALEFDRLLKEQIEHTIGQLDPGEHEYKQFLEASLANIKECRGGYFAKDNNSSNEEIAKEIDEILHGKKKLLSFKDQNGNWILRRFLFSKWTLKEGWDNPNVFTIAKLRSSGSENSKLQEVGRGLRLPVDENGNRISNEEFQLNYIVDFTEADFAQRLVDQINGEIPQAVQISEDRLCDVAHKLGMTADDLFDKLYNKHYIDRNKNVRPENRNQFLEEYPQFASGLSAGKVKDRNKEKPKPIKIRKAVYSEIRELWEHINQRYLLFYDPDLDAKMESVALSIFEKTGVFTDVVMSSSRDIVHSDGTQMSTTTGTGVQYTVMRPIAYGVFLSRIMRVTSIPIVTLHSAMIQYCTKHGAVDPKYINENSASAFCAEFQNWKVSQLQKRFRYVKSGTPCGATALTYADGSPREEIAQGRIGTKIAEGDPSSKYLYDVYAYDSPLEKDNITTEIEDVIVYGKIPRNSIAIPTITGGMFSPDFMYVVRKANGEKELNIVVETKDVEERDLRGNEKVKIECAKVFFDILSRDGYVVKFRDQLNNKQIAQIINEVLNS